MKKYFVLAFLLLLVGCGKNTDIICMRDSIDGYSYKEKVTATLNGNNIKSVKNVLTFDDLVEASLYCESLKNYKTYEDDKLSYNCDKKIITINNFELLIEDDVIGESKENYIALLTENKYACK